MTIRRLYSDDPVPEALRGAVAALGNFDGFHQGHQRVAGTALAMARERGAPAIIATFDPHPVAFFKPDLPPFALTTLDQRQDLFAAAGADAMLVFRFNETLAHLPPDAFVRDVLVGHLGLSGVVTGEDVAFGKGRAGNIDTLREEGGALGLAAVAVEPVRDERDDIVSSSRIRRMLETGRPDEAALLLTRPFTVRGRVMHGAKEGRRLGFPTANLELGNYIRPHYGIYAIRGTLPDGRLVDGAANVGIRPSYDPPVEWLEAHFFDFDADLYGAEIDVEFHHFLRPEAKFDDLDALKAQMADDCSEARKLLGSAS